MIIDPIATRIQAVSVAGLTSENISLDKVANEDKACSWRGISTALPGLRLDAQTAHDVTVKGRRRSKFRVDASYVDSSVSPAVTYTAGGYLVLDQVDLPSTKDYYVRNAALAAVLNAFVSTRSVGADHGPSQMAIDWLNGEP
jgi:hypothetical protein